MSMCNRFWCLPVSSPCQISEDIGHPCLQFPGPFSSITLSHSPCVKTFPLLLPFSWCYSIQTEFVERGQFGEVISKEKAEEEQGTLELTTPGN